MPRKKIGPTKKEKILIEERKQQSYFDWLLTFLSLSDTDPRAEVRPSYFTNAFVMNGVATDRLIEIARTGNTSEYRGTEIDRNARPPESDMDICTITPLEGVKHKTPQHRDKSGWALVASDLDEMLDGTGYDKMLAVRVRALSMTEKRRLVTFGVLQLPMSAIYSKIVESSIADITQDGKFDSLREHFIHVDGHYHYIPKRTRQLTKQGVLEWMWQVEMLTLLWHAQKSAWQVKMWYEGYPSIRIMSDVGGIKELYTSRDVPEDKLRKPTIRQWIKDHWREMPTDQEEETYVREHLRGATKFTWMGINCEVTPSIFDKEKEQQLITQRSTMRESGADRRPVS
jgi:hypothetical protein